MTIYASRAVRRRRWPLRVAAALAIVLLAVAGIELGGVAATLRHDRAVLDAGQSALTRQWTLEMGQTSGQDIGQPVPPKGQYRLWIPRLDLHWIVAEGVEKKDIAAAPGHFPGTAQPGQRGNASYAGHREQAMWADLDDVKPGDAVIVQGHATWWTYRVSVTRVVPPGDFAQIAPVPPGMSPGRLLTLMTCWPRWDSTKRLFVHAVLVRTAPADEPPAELTGAG